MCDAKQWSKSYVECYIIMFANASICHSNDTDIGPSDGIECFLTCREKIHDYFFLSVLEIYLAKNWWSVEK